MYHKFTRCLFILLTEDFNFITFPPLKRDKAMAPTDVRQNDKKKKVLQMSPLAVTLVTVTLVTVTHRLQ